MTRIAHYLQIPELYSRRLGGLAWSSRGDAIDWVRRNGEGDAVQTFLLAPELAKFLEALVEARGGRLLHLSHVLHFLNCLEFRPRPLDPEDTLPPPPPPALRRLARAFQDEGRPLRNAGALCGRLCRDFPDLPEQPRPLELVIRLNNDSSLSAWVNFEFDRWPIHRGNQNPEPPIDPDQFERLLTAAIEPLSDDELRTWLRTGTGPIDEVKDQFVDGLLALKPRSLEAALAAIARRDRLAGALPILSQLLGSLALPPRRSRPQVLPTGGYSDIGTRGRPEQILPSQFALDDIEFQRRYAERELLYFQREEPHQATTEELVILLDQGVRTWGKTRLALSAGAFALARRAALRGQNVLVGATGTDGRLFDPRLADDEALGTLWESSDLSEDPSPALRRILSEPGLESGSARDVVVLTHPRNAARSEFADATRLASPGTRVFSVAIDESGLVQFREFRAGTSVKVGDFRVHWAVPKLPPAEPISSRGDLSRAAWTGDVEPVGYPFRIAWPEPNGALQFDFSPDGEWFFAASPDGRVHAWRTDGLRDETLPRALIEDESLDRVDAILGVAGGFVLAGRLARSLVIAHYDMNRRTVQTRMLGSTWNQPWDWFYIPGDHLVIARGRDLCRGVDLSTRTVHLSRGNKTRAPASMIRAFESANNHLLPPPRLRIVHDSTESPDRGEWLDLDRRAGRMVIHGLTEKWHPFVPIVDGRPGLKGCWIEHAQRRGEILALVACQPNQAAKLWVINGSTGQTLQEFDHVPTRQRFLLSPDARRIARVVDSRKFDLRELGGASMRLSLTGLNGRTTTPPRVFLGPLGLIVVSSWSTTLIRWESTDLDVFEILGNGESSLNQALERANWSSKALLTSTAERPACLAHDPTRYIASAKLGGLHAVLDIHGMLAIFGKSGQLVVVFELGSLSAWMVDGATWVLVRHSDRGEEPDIASRIASGRKLASALRLAAVFPRNPRPGRPALGTLPPALSAIADPTTEDESWIDPDREGIKP